MANLLRSLLVILSLFIYVAPVSAGAIRTFAGFSPQTLSKGDDQSSTAIPLGFTINFHGQSKTAVYVNTNGNITFDGPFVGYPGMPSDNQSGTVIPDLNGIRSAIIAGFFADIDTSDPNLGSITYGTTTLAGRPVFVVNFSNIEYYRWYTVGVNDKHNSFQIILIDRSDTGAGNFDIEFNYDQAQWESSDSSGGTNGLGGLSAQIGYSNGTTTPGTFFQLPGSGVPGSFINGGLVNGSRDSGGVAGRYVFAIRSGAAPVGPMLSSLSPSTAQAGGSAFTLTVNGAGFAANSIVMWNGSNVPTSFVSSSQLTATVAANLIASQGGATVVVNTNGTASNSAAFTITAPAAAGAAISSLSPSTTQAGGSAFTLTVNGSGFAGNSTVLWNGSSLPTSFASANQLTASVASGLIASQGTATVTVSTNGAVSNSAAFTITAPAAAGPAISSLSPSTTQAGGSAFTLTVNGSGFAGNSAVLWNGSSLPTSFASANQLTASVAAGLIASQSNATVTVNTNGTLSSGSTFTITAGNSTPTISFLNPSTTAAGGAAFTLTVVGAGFAGNSTVLWNGEPLPTSFVSANQLTASIGANLIASQGNATVTVNTGVVASNAAGFTVTSPVNSTPTISILNPSTATAGGPAFTLTVNGSGFTTNSTVSWNGASLPTSFVSISQLTASVTAELIASQGGATVTVNAGGAVSNGAAFTIAAGPTISNLSPPSAQAGGPAFTLTVVGFGFTANSAITWNGASLPTSFVSANQLTATVAAGLIASQGTATVTVNTSGAPSGGATFTIAGTPGPVISSLSPSTALAGGPAFALTVTGFGFAANSTVSWNGASLPTSFVNAGQLTASVAAGLIASPGTATVTVTTNDATTSGAAFTITGNAGPTINTLNPSSTPAGSPAFTLTVNGSGFTPNSTVFWANSPLPTSFVSATQLTTSVDATLVAAQGTGAITVSVGGVFSNSSIFTVTAAAPHISTLSPPSAQAGGPAFTLTVIGSGFTSNSSITWNGPALTTTVVNANQLTASIPAHFIASQGIVTVTVNTGGLPSGGATFSITAATPDSSISSLRPSTAQAGSLPFILTVIGSGFGANSTISWNGASLPTSFVSATQLTAFITANLIATQGNATVTVNTSSANFTITAGSSNPAIGNLSPSVAAAGSPEFTLTVNGSGFSANSTISWNGASLPTSFVSATQLTASVTANLIASQGTGMVTVTTGGVTSNGSIFTITAAGANISTLSPPSAQAGGSALMLTVVGSGFGANSTISWNGALLTTSFVNANQLTASIAASLIASPGSAIVRVSTNGAVTGAAVFTVTAPPSDPVISALMPSTAQAGTAPFTLTVNGAGFTGSSTISWNGAALPTSFVSVNQLTAFITANLIAEPGNATVTVNTSSANFTITAVASSPTISILSPSQSQAGGAAFILTVNGAGFSANSTILWSGASLSTSFLNANQLRTSIAASFIASQGTATVTVNTDGVMSNGVDFTIVAAPSDPTISSLSPSSTKAGGAAFTLTVNGAGFTANSTIFWNGAPLLTSFLNANQLSVLISPALIASPGGATVTVSGNGVVSNGATFTMSLVPTISSLSPSTAQVAGPAFTLTVNGSGFSANSTVSWNGAALPTSFVSATQLTASVTANLIATQGNATVTVSTGGVVSNSAPFMITSASAPPTLTGLSPATAQAGGAAFILTVTGTGFTANSAVLWNGTSTLTSFVSATQLTATVAANLIASQGTATVSVNTGSTATNTLNFTVTAAPVAAPAISNLTPPTAQAGGLAFTLTVNGSGFGASNSTVVWNGTPLPTMFVNSNQLTAAVSPELFAQQGNASIYVTSGTQSSNTLAFTILGGAGSQVMSIFPTELSFTGMAGGPSPAPANLSVWSNGAAVPFHITASAGAWLDLSATSGQTNQGISVIPNTTGVEAGGYRGELIIQSDITPNDVRRIPVTLTVTPATDPQLEVSPLNQTIELPLRGQAAQYNLIVTNPGGGKLSFIAQTLGGDWLTLQNTYGSASAAAPSSLSYLVDPNGLAAGIYNAEIIVTDINSTQRLTTQITLLVSERRQSVVVSQAGLEFTVTAQQPPSSKNFSIRNDGSTPAVVSVDSDADGGSWLDTSPHLSSATLQPGAVTKINVLVNPQGLAPGRYVGLVRVRVGASGESVQTVPVLLNVQDSSASVARLSPAGITITGVSGVSSPSTATVGLFNPTASSITFSSVPGVDWLSLKPSSGSIAPFQTLAVEVSASFLKVPVGIRSDLIRIPFSDGILSTLNVQSVVNSVSGTSAVIQSAAAVASCIPSKLAVQLTSLEQGFTLTVGGIATIQAKVIDNCGNPRSSSSTVIARINSEPNPLMLSSEDQGIWSASWSPKNARAGVRVTVVAASNEGSTILTGQAAVTGTVNATSSILAVPTRVANAAGFQTGQISPGSWVSIFGDALAVGQTIAPSQPYPAELGGTKVTLGGIPLPLLFVDPKQINAFIPFHVPANTLQQLVIERRSTLSIPINIKIAEAVPGLYTLNQDGSGQGAITIAGEGVLAAPAPLGRPARRGEVLEMYSTGLGLVTNLPQDGQTASTSVLSPTVNPVTVTIGEANTTALFAGLAPGFIGLYQINVQVPDDAPTGDLIPVSITISGKESNIVTISLE